MKINAKIDIENELDLWIEYKRTNNINIRNLFINKYYKLINYSIKYKNNITAIGVELDDLMSLGTFGLIKAIETYNLRSKMKFTTFAIFLIKNAINDGLKELQYIPHHTLKKEKSITKIKERILEIKHRNAYGSEIANELGITIEGYNKMYKNYSAGLYPIEIFYSIEADSRLYPHILYEKNEITKLITDIIEGFNYISRVIIKLSYFHKVPARYIAMLFDCSESNIYRRLKYLKSQMKQQLIEQGIDFNVIKNR